MHKVFFDDDPSFRVFCRINIYHASDYYIKKEVFLCGVRIKEKGPWELSSACRSA